MRLHRLSVTAFGPYADTETVDFDELAGGGLFLLTGPTGAGKTSVLDAVMLRALRRAGARDDDAATGCAATTLPDDDPGGHRRAGR